MHIEVEGQGPALVMLHGWAMHAGVFAPLVRRLRRHYTLHLVDLPGHGHSRTDAGALCRAACAARIADAVPDAVWLGWSLGGLVALQAALPPARRVRGLVMLASTPRFVRAPEWPHGVDAALINDFARDLQRDHARTVERFLALESHGSEHARAELRSLRAELHARGEPSDSALQQGLAMLAGTDLRGALPTLGVPSLWLAGRRDRLVDWRAMQAAAALAPRSRFECIAGGAHAPFLGHPDRVADAVHAFASDLPA